MVNKEQIQARRQKRTNRQVVLVSIMLAMFMAAVEVTIVATAIPSIVGDLGGFSLFSWVFHPFFWPKLSLFQFTEISQIYTGEGLFYIRGFRFPFRFYALWVCQNV